MVEVKNFDLKKQELARIMICQFNFADYNWERKDDLYHIKNDENITSKIKEYLTIAKQHSVDLIIFPELSIPLKQVENLQAWSLQNECIIIGGSHYYPVEENFIPRCPVIINGEVFFTEKNYLSPLEKSPIFTKGALPGTKLLRFDNTILGNFAVLICADYLEESLKKSIDLQSLDFLFVPAFQKDSTIYYRRMNADIEDSEHGLYICYSNFLEDSYGDGNSSIFGHMDKIYSDKLKGAGLTDLDPKKKILSFKDETEYFIADFNLNNKRPYGNRNIKTEPNIKIITTNSLTRDKDIEFLKKISHDDERYKRIDELYVPPQEFQNICETLDQKNIVFIVGDPGIGKTYTALKILKEYFKRGYEPIWIAGLEKEERDLQSKVLRNFEPSSNQIVYFEDPFGRIAFERRDSLFQIFGPLMDKFTKTDSKILITSRKEIFENFTKESLLENEILDMREELNINKPSYNKDKLKEIFDRLVNTYCDWSDNNRFKKLVYTAIDKSKLTNPLAIRDLVLVSRNASSVKELQEQIKRRKNDNVRVFGVEILSTTNNIKLILYLVYFAGTKGKPFLSSLYDAVMAELMVKNLPVESLSFNTDMRSQIGFRIEQFGFHKTAYKFSHPVYEEALAKLILSNKDCEIIANSILQKIIDIEPEIAYKTVNRFVTKSPEVALILIKYILEEQEKLPNIKTKYSLTQRLISTYFQTKKIDFFELATKIYPLRDVIKDINNHFINWRDLAIQLNICQRYIHNSPLNYNSSVFTKDINWEKVFDYRNDSYFNHGKVVHLISICASIDPASIAIFIKKKGSNLIKKTYLFSDQNDRKRLYKLLRGNNLQKEIKDYSRKIKRIENESDISKFRLFRKVLFADHKYYGKLHIDQGARTAIKKPWLNLLPAGITRVEGNFEAGSVVGIMHKNKLIAVGMTEYSSEKMDIIKEHSTSEFNDLIGYYHTNCAIKTDFLKRLRNNEKVKWIYQN